MSHKKRITTKRQDPSPVSLNGESSPVSRILLKMAIYLGVTLPSRSSHLPGEAGPAYIPLHGVAPDRVYSGALSPGRRVVSYTAFPPLPRERAAVCFCCTRPDVAIGGRYPLSLPCGARTFLTHSLSAHARGHSENSVPFDHSSGLSQLCQTFCTSSLSSNTSSIFCMFFRSPSAVRVT